MCDVVGMPKLMGYAFMADTEILGARAQQVRIAVLVGAVPAAAMTKEFFV